MLRSRSRGSAPLCAVKFDLLSVLLLLSEVEAVLAVAASLGPFVIHCILLSLLDHPVATFVRLFMSVPPGGRR